MPVATLKFNLPEEKSEYNLANKAGEYYCALWEIEQHCRSVLKHGHSYKTIEDLAEAIRNMIPDSLYDE